MKKNVGKTDRMIRLGIGVIGLALGYMVSPWLYVVAVIGFGTAFMHFCPLYAIFGISTCPIAPAPEEQKPEEGTQM